ncbi:MAG: hypothetical protein KIS95_05490 [Anaerolineae bacterium]|uniref:hypothetical protein n=1 Tax=Promineifilum sp. TaxID=2664178 RepID=UPI001D467620|nr:hypothetical protein [Anaerolineales bacterium]MCB8934666.1 hypothetical protein [Promineifilum sp.]MCO5180976.1 hypothetical protein [Promineifilum sp.]MCW5846662.1 hypothetical protein [Anaerolineae bacterium]
MKPKLVVLVVVLLLLAMVPALAMAQNRAKPEKVISFTIDRRQPVGPQVQAALGAPIGAPKADAPAAAPRANAPAALGIQPNAVYGLLKEGFEGPWPDGNWIVWDFSGIDVCWGTTNYMQRYGLYSAWPAAGCYWGYDPGYFPYYVDNMDTWMDYPMDLQGARRARLQFHWKNDSEYGYDYFLMCASHEGYYFYCDAHTGSTNNKWRFTKIDLKNFQGQNFLDDPGFVFSWGFYSDYIVSYGYEGAYVDAIRLRAWGP